MPKGYKFRAALETTNGYQPARLFVDGYYKPTSIAGVRDKLSFSVIFNEVRIFGVDDGNPPGHRNDVGVGRALFGQRIDHPHLHTVSDDALDGYAEPLESAEPAALWILFLERANIQSAPGFSVPVYQPNLL